jgi:hypothetical protein
MTFAKDFFFKSKGVTKNKMENSKWEKFIVPISCKKKVDLAKVFKGENSFMIIYAEIFY